MTKAEDWIQHLALEKHPEGGYFREVYRSPEMMDSLPVRYEGSRNFSTSIYYLLKSDQYSAFHKILSDELWHFYDGCPLDLFIIDSIGELSQIVLGRDVRNGEQLQTVVKKEQWFAARPKDVQDYSLLGCTVAPGFDFRDFEMGDRKDLIEKYPQHGDLIRELT